MLFLVASALAFDPTLSAAAGYDLHQPADVLQSGFFWSVRGGLQNKQFDLELAVNGHTGLARGTDWPTYQVAPRLEVAWHPDHQLRIDPFIAAGVGYRYSRIDDGTTRKEDVTRVFNFTGDPIIEALLTAGGGATMTIWGPIHLRADVRGNLLLGPDADGYTLGGGEFSLGVEYRSEGLPDADRDGVPDKKDFCPQNKEDLDSFEDLDGCLDPDDDQDGTLDVDDVCKDDKEDKDGYQDQDGCPDRNNDSDNLPDDVDKCPDQAETDNNFDDQDGCPDTTPADLIPFDDHKLAGLTWTESKLDATARPLLDPLIAALLAHPKQRIKVSCYTDDDGAIAALKDRTEARGTEIAEILAAAGVDRKRVEVIFWGPSFALQPNTTPEGRLANNRCTTILID